MSEPKKILEISGEDWMKGTSAKAYYPIGGIFQTATEFHPFDYPGYLRASVQPETVDNTTLSTSVKAVVSAKTSGVGYVFAIGNRAGTGTKCFYRIKTSDNTVTDYSSGVATNVGTGAVTLGGLTVDSDGGQIIYAEMNNGNIRRVSFSGTGDANIKTLAGYNASYPVVFFRGAEGYYYATTGLSTGVVEQFHGSASSWTAPGVWYTIEVGKTAKDGCNDGTYTAIIGDDNPDNVTGTSSQCSIYFFLPGGTTWSYKWDIPDQYIVSCRYVAGRILVIGASGIWECAVNISPRLVMPLGSTQLPSNPYMVDVHQNIMYWASASTGALVYGYGHRFLGKPILFSPYDSASDSSLHTCLATAGNYFYAGLNSPKVVAHNWGSTRANSTAMTVPAQLPTSFSLSYVRVILKSPLASGQSIGLSLFNANDEVIMDTSTRSYTTFGALRTLRFEPLPGSTPISRFDDLYLSINPVAGAIVERVAVYGTPQADNEQRK